MRTFWASDRGSLSASNFYNYFIWGSFCSVIIYIFGIGISFLLSAVLDTIPKNAFSGIGVHLPTFKGFALSINEVSEVVKSTDVPFLIWHVICIAIFSLFCDALAVILGLWSRRFILDRELDLKYDLFRFKNEWFYITTGRSKPGVRHNSAEVHLLHEIGNSEVLYRGVVENYTLKDEHLEFLHLTNVYRTGFISWEQHYGAIETSENGEPIKWTKKDLNVNPSFYPLTQDATLIFKASEIKNLHINYSSNNKLIAPVKEAVAEDSRISPLRRWLKRRFSALKKSENTAE